MVTPPLTGTLLPGVTRDTLLTLAARRGYTVREERVCVEQWRAESASGLVTETFACGTAALVTPVGEVCDGTDRWTIGGGKPGPLTLEMRDALGDLHQGRVPDPHGRLRVHGGR
ncbi:hypothetical protein FRZ03_08195 [Streptomyces misionensis]|uniref:Branched-chain amino acid aminotransferase n=1 Tax=Streptomyces misionensis TaxID=67331 RepID=A0A5C6JYM7_9ACTN|nr:aminotransferase class IV [Streptomyces misionensis]TWV53936.1 hypothetical protein FRZ03_08195 [Streptomyces misionensis]